LLLRLVERLYVWAQERERRIDRQANAAWWSRMTEHYRRADAGRLE
jgi:hypothetical protein